MKAPRQLKTVVLVLCLVGLPIVAFWLGWNLLDAKNRIRDLRSRGKFDGLELALQSYHEEHGVFPPTKYQRVAGGPIHSWRVLLGPYMGGDERYSRYDFSQEWNSTNNLQALSGWPAPNHRIMPCGTFRLKDDGDTTHYLAIGEGDEWPLKRPLRSRLVTKGKDRFLLVEDTNSTIHWMEPKY